MGVPTAAEPVYLSAVELPQPYTPPKTRSFTRDALSHVSACSYNLRDSSVL